MISNAKLPKSVWRYGGFVVSVGGARVAGILITSVTFPFLVRRLGVETYGLWSYVLAICAFIEIVSNPGLSTHISQQVAARRHAAAELLPDFLVLRILCCAVAFLMLLTVAAFEVRPEVRRLLLGYGAGILCAALTTSDFLLNSLELFHVRSVQVVCQQALYAAGVLWLVRSPKDIVWVPASIVGSVLITNAAGWVVLWRHGFRPPFAIDPSRWWGILVPSFHYAGRLTMSAIYHRTGHIVVRWFLGEHVLGLYAAALRLVDILYTFASIVPNVLMPRMALSAQSPAGTKRLVQVSVSVVAAISLPMMFGTLATAHLVVPWVMGAGFAEAVRPTRWMAPMVVAASSAGLLSSTILYALGRHRAYLISGIAGAVSAILLYLILVPLLGLKGACIAAVLSEIVVAATAYLLIPHELQDLWKNPIIPIAGFSALIMVAAILLVNAYSSRPLLVAGVGAAVYIAVFGLLSRKLLMQQFGAAG